MQYFILNEFHKECTVKSCNRSITCLLKAQILLVDVNGYSHKLKLKQNSWCVLVKTKGFVPWSVSVCLVVSWGPCRVCVSWDWSVLSVGCVFLSALRWNTGLHSETVVTRAEVIAMGKETAILYHMHKVRGLGGGVSEQV